MLPIIVGKKIYSGVKSIAMLQHVRIDQTVFVCIRISDLQWTAVYSD